MNDDAELLRRYVEKNDDEAFAELVRRQVNLVYSAALRQLNGDAHLAADATQLVFTDLARKASALLKHRVLAGWLFTSTRYTTAKLVRGVRRRQVREQEAQLMHEITHDETTLAADWQQVRPVLDDVMGELNENDREAILVRFFEGRDYASVGAKLHLAENTARMRVERALDKLRGLLERRGVKSTSAALAVALAHQAVVAAPTGLAATVTGVALAGGGVVGFTATVINFMSITKLQLGFSGALAAAGATGLVLQADTNAKLRDEISLLKQETADVRTLETENLRLARLVVEVEEMRRDDNEFERLQQEAGGLRTRLQELANAERARAAAPLSISQLDRTPVPRFQARPQYPFEMRRAGVNGEVVVDFVIDANGDVKNAIAVRSSQREFEAAAVESVSKWKFKPGQKGGRDVDSRMQVPIVFTLDGVSPAPQSTVRYEAKGDGAAGRIQLQPVVVKNEGAETAGPSVNRP